MKVLQINTTINTGSTGRIAEEIGKLLIAKKNSSYIAFGRGNNESQSVKIKVGTQTDFYLHTLNTRLLDRHGFSSANATKKLIRQIAEIQPDIIHLHNIHGYYLNLQVLFNFLRTYDKPVVWTLHDCWAFTGHCAFFEDINCEKWKSLCHTCPKTGKYPNSWLLDNSKRNYTDKKELFTSTPLHLVVPSKWLSNLVAKSFLGSSSTSIIYNGIDLKIFRPLTGEELKEYSSLHGKKIILGVANVWDGRKGLNDFILLSQLISEEYKIVLVGLTSKQAKELPPNILGISRTENVKQLASFYSSAQVFVNPTYLDNFPTTNIEALACGTPVITYSTGGSPEAVNDDTGFVVEKGNIGNVWSAIQEIEKRGRDFYKKSCRDRAVENFNKDERFKEYLSLYQEILKESKRG